MSTPEQQKRVRQRRRERGVCVRCGRPKPCTNCARLRKKYRKDIAKKAACPCGQPSAPRRKSCVDCLKAKRDAWSAEQQHRKDNKLCWRCGGPGDHQPNRNNPRGRWRCFACWIVQLARNWNLDPENLHRLWNQQQGRCRYTREHLDPTTAHLDHIEPRSKAGGMGIDNVQFLHEKINAMKHDMGHDEFIAACKTILRHTGS